MGDTHPFFTIRNSRRPADGSSLSSGDSTYGSSAGDEKTQAATHDISRVNYHVKHVTDFAKTLEDSAARAFPNNRNSQRYKKVHAVLLHWNVDDLFVLPELEDLETCFRQEYGFETEVFPIPSENAHLELMLRIGAMIKEHESNDTLFIVYYGGHAKIDESRQSTWCATRNSDSPWLQWSAIQTLLERSLSDVLILLDCCAGAASATFPNGNSITETISASSWDAIAPDPGRYSFTNALIEVLNEWRVRTFSAAMLHAEVLARLKHPRPIMLNGKHFEARSTPVHFMMTANHRAPSIEMSRVVPHDKRPPSPPQDSGPVHDVDSVPSGRSNDGPQEIIGSEPNEDRPHVMISLALEEDQRLNINEWETWLAALPALAKFVKVQGVFKSHSTLLLLSMPVMVWDLLPDNPACNFVAFVRSNNLAIRDNADNESVMEEEAPVGREVDVGSIRDSIMSGTTAWTANDLGIYGGRRGSTRTGISTFDAPPRRLPSISAGHMTPHEPASIVAARNVGLSLPEGGGPGLLRSVSHDDITRTPILNLNRGQQRTYLAPGTSVPPRPRLAPHVEARLEKYFLDNPVPTNAVKEFLASNLGIETADIDLWFFHRRDQQEVSNRLQSLEFETHTSEPPKDGPRMILPGHLNTLLEIVPPSQMLVMDLRSSLNFERSHIHGAINFRVPASFVARATIDMIEGALADDLSQEAFNRWDTSRCIVFYDRHVGFTWEAPTAEALYQKFRSKDWKGQCFVLKGHYREFSESFDKYISGSKMTDAARDYLCSQSDKSMEKRKDDQAQYNDWLKHLEEEDQIYHNTLVPAARAERMEAMVEHQNEVEADFEQRQPSLYTKAQDRRPDGNWDIKAPMVPHLARGITKMQQASMAVSAAGDSKADYSYQKSGGDTLLPSSEEYDMMESDDEVLQKAKPSSAKASSSMDDYTGEKKAAQRGGIGTTFFNKIRRGNHQHR